MNIMIKRAYEKSATSDGFRILVDRLWPRGISKAKAHIDLWLKDIAPTNQLRTWFKHDPKKWQEFVKKYRKELQEHKDLVQLLKFFIKEKNKVTFIYAAHDEEYNNAKALKKILETK